eukprot:989822-Ditylum_brightwellii.AAC.1
MSQQEIQWYGSYVGRSPGSFPGLRSVLIPFYLLLWRELWFFVTTFYGTLRQVRAHQITVLPPTAVFATQSSAVELIVS